MDSSSQFVGALPPGPKDLPAHARPRQVERHRGLATAAVFLLSFTLGGCVVATVVGAAAGAAISVTGAVVSTGVSLTGKAVGKALDAMSGGDDAAAATAPATPVPAAPTPADPRAPAPVPAASGPSPTPRWAPR